MSDTTRTAIIGGVLAVIGTIAGATATGWFQLQLTRQKLNSDLVMKALEPNSGEERLESLRFLIETNLIKDSEIREGVRAYAKSKASDPSSVPQISSAIKPSARLVLKEFQSGPYKVEIPSDVESMWVFYQSKSVQNPNGCQRPPNADPITPKAVAERIDELIKHASAKEDIALIFTAFSRERGWDAAASEIRNQWQGS